jgi:aryl-alcohol dehydrogenase-like predicted oxidoreductase
MQYRRFGRTNLLVSVMGIGTGGPSRFGQGSGVAEPEAARTLRRALELGINLIDTAANYRGSEERLGNALRGVPRDSYIMCTKFSPYRAGEGGAAAGAADADPLKDEGALRESLEASLQRLNLDHVDVLQLHGVTPPQYEAVRDRFVPAMRKAQADGKCRFLGITETFGSRDDKHEMLPMACADGIFDTAMVGYNMLTPLPESTALAAAQQHDVGVLVMCAVRRAIANPEKLQAVVAELKASGELAADALPETGPFDWLIGDGVESVAAAAYKFAADHPAVSCVLTGTATQSHLEENVRAILGRTLAPADRRRLVETFLPIGRNLGN